MGGACTGRLPGGVGAAVTRLRVDPIACDGRGLCAELLPEWIDADSWGYPIIRPEPLPAGLRAAARRAASACPCLALRLEPEAKGRSGG
ncbi:MAG TPA: ferredoxin [Candidatus Micrarchaeia archaeon]|nr:ferredoxin [Candidatus Micrarchaeia archaeon]